MSEQLLDTPAKHSFSFASLADSAWNSLREAAFKTGWKPATRLAEAAVVALMQNITKGQLRVLTCDHIYIFPVPGSKEEAENEMPDLKAELRVVNDVFWVRLCTMSDLGFAEAYMYGDVECEDLVSVFLMFIYNRESLASMTSKASYLFSIPQKLTSYRFVNSIGNSRSNISAHYDISNDMFKGFLSEDMTYSCAIFDELDGDLKDGTTARGSWSGGEGLTRLGLYIKNLSLASSGDNSRSSTPTLPSSPLLKAQLDAKQDPLHAAQLRKLSHIIRKANILPGQTILEIGSGWGSMAILIARTIPGTIIHTLTLSVHQRELALARVKEAGIEEGRVQVHLLDYRNVKNREEWRGAFDRVISIEMVEAVGGEYLAEYWSVIDWALRPRTGVGVIQGITIPESRFEKYQSEVDFIRKWSKQTAFLASAHLFTTLRVITVFPGGLLPSISLLIETMQKGSNGRLIVDSISNIGPHYARTLREWRHRFLERFDDVVVPALVREYPNVMGGERGRREIEVFKRKWIYYYCYCEVGFTTRTLGDHIITFTREGHEEYGCQVFE
ncbi:CFS1-like protein [Neolentinus lepideus HHB14362 ss-1]|uniref:CFS1-like protein n=1 Tax=Neolentinus lepideus HHB14362 ss-1 TaxID=1314782 RepID=A0A165R9A2_9AGAM|nr:CFS1-like protein [Neolentinus lepideus HHB14362 ss-1]